jgi:hypothetical protein
MHDPPACPRVIPGEPGHREQRPCDCHEDRVVGDPRGAGAARVPLDVSVQQDLASCGRSQAPESQCACGQLLLSRWPHRCTSAATEG